MYKIFQSYMKSRLIFIIILVVTITSCRKFVEIGPAPNLVATSAIFENDNTATAAAVQVYVQMRISNQKFTDAGMSIYGGLSSDEIFNTTSNAIWDPFLKNDLTDMDGSVKTNFWNTAYVNLYQVNAILEGISKSDNLSESARKQLSGEMKTVRAWYYFYLVNLFGDVPLVISTDYRTNEIMPRTPVAQVYAQIIKDLKDAQELLSDSYPSSGKTRPNKWVATAMLARVYLFMQDWTNADIQASSVINSNQYSLVSDLNSVFLKNSSETLWEIAPRNGLGSTNIANFYIPSSPSSVPQFSITSDLINAFEAGDLRKINWIKTVSIGNQAYNYPYKYKEKSTSSNINEYNTVLRLDEQYLIRSEARAEMGRIPDAQADLNIVRARAGLGNTTATDKPTLLSAILHERQVELFTEWGHRWLDLKRTGKVDSVLTQEKGANWQATDALYPIPFDELKYNPSLIQNPGY